jgi:hypothetical protein
MWIKRTLPSKAVLGTDFRNNPGFLYTKGDQLSNQHAQFLVSYPQLS